MRWRFLLTIVAWSSAEPASAAVDGVTSEAKEAGAVSAQGAPEPDASTRALAVGMAALAEKPPRRDVARLAFERATAGGGQPSTVSQAHFRLGVLDEGDAAPARALVHYHASVDAAPSGRWARTARGRIAWIDRRAEGDLGPLATLQRVTNDPAVLHDPGAIDRLAQEAESFPPGLVRAEARALVAESWLKRPMRRDDALSELRKVVDDPSSGSAVAVFAERDLVEALLARKQLDAAADEIRAHPLDSKSAAEVQRLVRRRSLRRAAWTELLAALALVMALVVRARVLRGRAGRRSATIPPVRRRSPSLLAAVVVLGGLSAIAAAVVVADATDAQRFHDYGL